MAKRSDPIRKKKFFNDINDSGEGAKAEGNNPLRSYELYEVWEPAFEELLTRCPDGVETARYERALVDAKIFLATWGKQAKALGWTVDDVFGLDPIAPLRRYEVMGLIWLLRGNSVTAITEQTAVIKMSTGNQLTFYRRNASFPWRQCL